jgi:hypothetical protein
METGYRSQQMISAQELTLLKLFSAAVFLAAVLPAFGPSRSASAEPFEPFTVGHVDLCR